MFYIRALLIILIKIQIFKLEEERTMDIQRENNLLNEKISHIKKTTGGVDSWNIFEKKR